MPRPQLLILGQFTVDFLSVSGKRLADPAYLVVGRMGHKAIATACPEEGEGKFEQRQIGPAALMPTPARPGCAWSVQARHSTPNCRAGISIALCNSARVIGPSFRSASCSASTTGRYESAGLRKSARMVMTRLNEGARSLYFLGMRCRDGGEETVKEEMAFSRILAESV